MKGKHVILIYIYIHFWDKENIFIEVFNCSIRYMLNIFA